METRTVTTTVTPPAPEVEEPPCDPAVDIDCVPAATRRTPRHSGHVATPQSVTIVRTQPAAGRSVERRTVRERTGPAVPDEWEARIVLQSDIGPLRTVANAVAVLPDGGDLLWAYAAGVRWQFHPALAAGVEAAGEFTTDGEHELITGLTWTPTHHLSLRGGVGIGLSASAPDVSVHTGVVWRF